jgi:hypothetical protein
MEKLLPIDPSSSGTKHLHESMTSKQEKPLRTCQVGLTMDVSSNLCNSAHYNVNDASTGFAVWTETIPGNRAQKWYFVLPNVYGKRHDGTTYEGVAVELEHGVAISWDGRQVKHCSFYIENTKSPLNYLYGTFCGTKFNLIDLGLDGKGQIYDEPENETQTTSPASPSVASLPVHDDSDDVNNGLFDALRSVTYCSKGEIKRALDDLMANQQTNDADWHNLMGFAYRKQQPPDIARSEFHYREALKIKADHRGALEYYGELLLMKNDLAGAEENAQAPQQSMLFRLRGVARP